eukprot:Pgem_evm1s15762
MNICSNSIDNEGLNGNNNQNPIANYNYNVTYANDDDDDIDDDEEDEEEDAPTATVTYALPSNSAFITVTYQQLLSQINITMIVPGLNYFALTPV